MSEKRLIVVDDNLEMSKIVQRVATQLGYEAISIRHGYDFMQEYDEFDPDVVMLDMVMPDIDGIELVYWLKDKNCKAKILVASAFGPHYAEMAESIGTISGLDISFNDKPFQLADLRAALDPACGADR